jgi:hypothetical protein
MHGSINKKNELWEIKIFKQPHVCTNQTPRKDHKQLTSAIVGGLILDIVRADLEIKPVTIIEAVKLKVEYTISYWKRGTRSNMRFDSYSGVGGRHIICFPN